MNRQRLTWGASAPNKRASGHPATPDEGPAHPAGTGKDPEANAYANGDTSSWGEDVHPGPYPQSGHPATPDEGPAHPAYKAAALERRASRCIRLASAMLGPDVVASVIEDQALALMDLSDTAITASLKRLGAEDEEEVEEETGEENKKKASDRFASLENRMARIERILIRLAGDEDEEEEEVEEESKKKASDDEDEEEVEEEVDEETKKKASEDAELEAMLAEEGMSDEPSLDAMLAEEGMTDAEVSEEPCADDMDMGFEETGDIDMMMGDLEDPMGVMDGGFDADEQMILAKLYGKEAGEEVEEEEVEEETKKKASFTGKSAAERTAAQRPQPKKASTGPARLGAVSKVAGQSNEVDDLSKIWSSAPDVSRHF